MVSNVDPHVAELKSYNLYHLHVCLRNGRELIAKDSGGTSDPYVKFYWKGKQVYKSKTIDKDLNPVWDESFIMAIDDPFVPLEIKVRASVLSIRLKILPVRAFSKRFL